MVDVTEETELRNLSDSAKMALAKVLDKEGIYHYQGSCGTQEEWKTLMAHIPEFMPVTAENIFQGKRKYCTQHIQLIEEESRRQGVSAFKILLGEWGTSGRIRPKISDLLFLLNKLEMRRAVDFVNLDLLKREVSLDTENELGSLLPSIGEHRHETVNLVNDVGSAMEKLMQEEELVNQLVAQNSAPLELTPRLIAWITNDFQEKLFTEGGRRLDSRGSFGSVYVGIIPSQTEDHLLHKLRIKSLRYQPFRLEDNTTRVAVKRIKIGDDQSKKMFDAEVRALKRLKHRNIIPLLGFSNDGNFGNLIYPLMISGSLDSRLACKRGEVPLPWSVRVDILYDVAKGLEYIHGLKTPEGTTLVHRDIKSANILLDENLNAKISDFGLLRDVPNRDMNKTVIMTQTPVGTNCYMPIEAFRGVVDTSWDVYSFGVVILEVLTGLPPIDDNCQLLSSCCDNGRRISDLLDTNAGEWPESTVEGLFALSRRCLGEKRARHSASALAEEIRKMTKQSPVQLDYDYLKAITNGFDGKPADFGGRQLGAGGFGIVYVGTLSYQQGESVNVTLLRRQAAKIQGITESQLIRVAVKRLEKKVTDSEQAELKMSQQFMTEIESMSRFNHPHLLPLLGYCIPKVDDHGEKTVTFEERCLVYPLMVNGSLQDRLECKNQSLALQWETRARILKQVCSAIKYLHTFDKKTYIHRDIKSANVLLDEHCFAKISDFGSVRVGKSGVSTGRFETDHPLGTPIYMSLEAFRGDISAKMDVFSFGVVILEVLSGLVADPENEVGLIVESPSGFPMIHLDRKAGEWPDELADGLFQLAKKCIAQKLERPTSTQVFYELSSVVDYWLGGVTV